MPELPEVETIARALEKTIVGKEISKVEVLTKNLFHGSVNDVIGKKIASVARLGKVLAIKLSDASFLSFHFMLSGQLLYSPNVGNAVFINSIPLAQTNKMPGKSTRVIFNFVDGSGLFFNEMRMFGWVKHSGRIEGPTGVDILSSDFTKQYFASVLSKTKRAIKIILLEQNKYAGIGNIYANEALFEAKIHLETQANKLSENQVLDLYNAIKSVIDKAIKYKGSSGKDEVYVLPDSTKGEYQNHFMVYQKNGKSCMRCNSFIVRIELGGRGTFYCPTCQTT